MSVEEASSYLEPATTQIRDPLTGRSIWLAGLVREPVIDKGSLKYTLAFQPKHTPTMRQEIQERIRTGLEALGWDGPVICNVRLPKLPGAPPASKPRVKGMQGGGMQPHGGPITKKPLEGVKHLIAVASGKGGVGKSTVATNLACGLAKLGYKVGLMDADIYGPSLPLMMKVQGKPIGDENRKILPLHSYGVKCMSIGFMVDPGEPIIWRGPMVMGVVKQFLQDVNWGDTDYLIVDLPPGTGDAQLTMIQATPIAGALIVTTPQDLALLDAERGIAMFEKLEVPVLGIVENMSYLTLPNGDKIHPFGQGGGAKMATAHGVALLGQIPLDPAIRVGGDTGAPQVLEEEEAGCFTKLARTVALKLPVEA
jgi:ATP-binding protein involved in chromosome partitioning